jgi:hypothetical protein
MKPIFTVGALQPRGAGVSPAGCVGVSPTVSGPRTGTVRKPAAVDGCATSVADGHHPPRGRQSG